MNFVVPQRVKEKLKDKELQDLFEQALIEAEDLLNRKGWIAKQKCNIIVH